jgi:hypothetical protein
MHGLLASAFTAVLVAKRLRAIAVIIIIIIEDNYT